MSVVDKIKSLDRKYSMERFYQTTGGSRQKYGQLKLVSKSKKSLEDTIISYVRSWRVNHPSMGSRVLYQSMSEAGIDIPFGITAFEKLMSRKGLTVQTRKRFFPRTSDGKGKNNHPNLTNGLILNDINQHIAADITYFQINQRWYYLFLLKDVYSQRLISLIPSKNLQAIHAVKTLFDLKKLRGKKALHSCIHHSDNGSQYESRQFLQRLADLKLRVSRAESCDQNGSIEQMNHIVKNMYLHHMGITNFKHLTKACRKVIRLMNEGRSIKQLNGMSVDQFEQKLIDLPDDHKPIKVMHDFS